MASADAVSIDAIPSAGMDDETLLRIAEQFKALRLFSLRNDPECFGSTYSKEVEYPISRWKQRLQSPDAFHIIASLPRNDNGAPPRPGLLSSEWVGAIVPRLLGEKSDAEDRPYIITAMFVSPSVRGLGVGSRLLKRALEVIRADAEQRGSTLARVELVVNAVNAAAIALYKRCGFYEKQSTPEDVSVSGKPEVGMYLVLDV